MQAALRLVTQLFAVENAVRQEMANQPSTISPQPVIQRLIAENVARALVAEQSGQMLITGE